MTAFRAQRSREGPDHLCPRPGTQQRRPGLPALGALQRWRQRERDVGASQTNCKPQATRAPGPGCPLLSPHPHTDSGFTPWKAQGDRAGVPKSRPPARAPGHGLCLLAFPGTSRRAQRGSAGPSPVCGDCGPAPLGLRAWELRGDGSALCPHLVWTLPEVPRGRQALATAPAWAQPRSNFPGLWAGPSRGLRPALPGPSGQLPGQRASPPTRPGPPCQAGWLVLGVRQEGAGLPGHRTLPGTPKLT